MHKAEMLGFSHKDELHKGNWFFSQRRITESSSFKYQEISFESSHSASFTTGAPVLSPPSLSTLFYLRYFLSPHRDFHV